MIVAIEEFILRVLETNKKTQYLKNQEKDVIFLVIASGIKVFFLINEPMDQILAILINPMMVYLSKLSILIKLI
jgi:hypothetical protein